MTENDIKAIVQETVPVVLQTYGVDITDPIAAQANMAWVTRRRLSEEKLTIRTRMVLATTLLSSAVTGIVFLVKEVLRGTGGS